MDSGASCFVFFLPGFDVDVQGARFVDEFFGRPGLFDLAVVDAAVAGV